MREILKELDLGNSVAEFDESLEKYFVETSTFRDLVRDRIDVVAGDKGTGKTAIYKVLQRRYRELPELADTEIITAFNPTGNPVFQRLVHEEPLSEGQYRGVWKTYFLSLIGNWALNIAGEETSESFKSLHLLLERTGLRANDDTPQTIFNRLANTIHRVLNPKTAEVELTMSETGIPIVKNKIELGDSNEWR